jgi:hypothetical protein
VGRRSVSGGVTPIGHHRIQFDFTIDGVRYRPTLPWIPHEANLRRARQYLAGIKMRIAATPIRRHAEVYGRWRATLKQLPIRYRKPYAARHSSVSWHLMVGKNPLWVAAQHGHSVVTMLSVYAAWTHGARAEEIAAIRRAMRTRPRSLERRAALSGTW